MKLCSMAGSSEKVARVPIDPLVQETLSNIRSVCEILPRYRDEEEAIKARCMSKELAYEDLYDMSEDQVNSVLGVGGGFSRVLLKNAEEVARGLMEGDKGFRCRICPLKYPFAGRLRRHEAMSRHQPYVLGTRVKQEATEAAEDTVEEVVIDLAEEEGELAEVKEEGLGQLSLEAETVRGESRRSRGGPAVEGSKEAGRRGVSETSRPSRGGGEPSAGEKRGRDEREGSGRAGEAQKVLPASTNNPQTGEPQS